MNQNPNIPIRNIYYMFSYAYQTLVFSEYQNLGTEDFQDVTELYAEILKLGIPVLIRGGLLKDYIQVSEKTTVIRGKIDMNQSIKRNSLIDKKLVVAYDEFSEDILFNRIIKAMLFFLARSTKISRVNQKIFFGFLTYFTEVSDIELNLQLWNKVQYNRQNLRYQFIIDICRYLYEELLLDESSSDVLMRQVKDEQRLSSLYEKFVFAFYKRESDYLVTHPQISWKVDDGYQEALPMMQTDLVLTHENKTLIVDTKFYSDNMVTRFKGGTAKQRSENLYQMFTYVNNWKFEPGELVGGMLLYARTLTDVQPEHNYKINGNNISVVNLNLNQDFQGIKHDLLSYADTFFGRMNP